MKLRPAKRKLVLLYKTASASFGAPVEARTEVPATFELVAPRRKLTELAEECCAALDTFSRRLGRDRATRDTIASLALLPPELTATRISGEASQLCEKLSAAVQADHPIPIAELARHILSHTPESLKKKDATLLAQTLERLGFGMEPDVRFGAATPRSDARVIVFQLSKGAPNAPSPAYTAASLLMHLAVMVAASDDDISHEEEQQLEQHVTEGLHLRLDERNRLSALLRWLKRSPPGWAGMKRRLQNLDYGQRESIAEFLVGIALADGRVDPREVKVLTRIYRSLELDPGAVHEVIHRLSSRAGSAGDDPVIVRPASSRPGFSIPQRPSPDQPEPDPVLSLDMGRISSRLQETASVSALLAGVFAEAIEEEPEHLNAHSDSPSSTEPTDVASPGASNDSHGLDEALVSLLHRLGAKESWSRLEFEDLAETLGLFPDGALDQLNDLAFEVCDEPVCDGDDPLIIDSDIYSRLTADIAKT